MSLIKQLWIGIVVLMLIAFGGSFVVSTLTGKLYLEQQIQLKNMDNVTALALSLSQMEKDPVRLELLISAQFDVGHYEWITLTSPDNEILVERRQQQDLAFSAPTWFHRLIPLEVEPASAMIQDGWQQFGELSLNSHTGYAIDNLWDGTIRMVFWFLAVSLAAGLFGTYFLRTVARPLDSVVTQAEAIGERRFIFSDEPKTQEFRRLVNAMNRLSHRVRAMLEREAQQLEKMRVELQHDALTGLPNRTFFMAKLEQFVSSDESEQAGVFIIVRVLDLHTINTLLGHREADEILIRIAAEVASVTSEYEVSFVGRLNGSDFALLVAQRHLTEAVPEALRQKLNNLVAEMEDQVSLSLPMACCEINPGVSRAALLASADGALASAEIKGNQGWHSSRAGQSAHRRTELEEWRTVIARMLDDDDVVLGHFPVKALDGSIVQVECPVRMHLDGELRHAAYFLPWVSRLGALPKMDIKVIKKAISGLVEESSEAVNAINVSTETLLDPSAREELLAVIRSNGSIAPLLALEFSQATVIRYPDAFRLMCSELKALGCQVGVKHVGDNLSRISQLHDLGLDYIKIDGVLSRNIAESKEQQVFIRGLCTLGHSLGINMIAVSVTSSEEQAVLKDLGIDAITGPFVA